jgi:hypothetical protein
MKERRLMKQAGSCLALGRIDALLDNWARLGMRRDRKLYLP